jgi:hypothetical protein
MWHFDPELQRQFDHIRRMANLASLTPTREWPLLFMEEHDALFVVREWPNGEITAYTRSESSKADPK